MPQPFTLWNSSKVLIVGGGFGLAHEVIDVRESIDHNNDDPDLDPTRMLAHGIGAKIGHVALYCGGLNLATSSAQDKCFAFCSGGNLIF